MEGQLQSRIFQKIKEREVAEGRVITQKEIAEACGVSEPTIGRWVKNDLGRLEIRTLEKLCNYFGCDVGDLLYIERGK